MPIFGSVPLAHAQAEPAHGPSAAPASVSVETSPPPASPPSEDPAPIEVEVVGRREPPASASEVTVPRRVVAAAPHRTAADMLQVVPGIAISQHGGEGKAYQLFYRGFDAVHGQDLEIWAGGAPVNDVSNLHGQGYADLSFIPPELVQAVTAHPGTYRPDQGDFAVAGTLRLRLGYDEPGVTAKATLGQFGSRRYFMAYHPEAMSEETFAAFEVYQTDGFGPSRAAQRGSAIGQVSHELSNGGYARLFVSAYAARYATAGVLRLEDLESGARGRYDTYDPKQGGDAARLQISAELGRRGPRTEWSIAPYGVMRSMRLRDNFTGYLVDPAHGDATQQRNDAITVGALASFTVAPGWFSKDDSLTAGISLRTDGIEQSQRHLDMVDSTVLRADVDASVRATDVAGHVGAVLHPLSFLTVQGGLRLDGLFYATDERDAEAGGVARSAMGAHLGKRAGLVLSPIRKVDILFNYGDGFRSPQARSLADGETTPFTEVHSVEGGARGRLGPLQGSIAAFHTWLSDDLAFDPKTARNERVPATARTGVTGWLGSQPATWLSSSTSFTFTRAAFTESGSGYEAGDLLPYVPQLVVRTDTAFTPEIVRFGGRTLKAKLGSGVSLQHNRPLPYGEMAHDVLLVDATAQVRWGEVEVGVDAYNLLDAVWYDGEATYASSFSRQGDASLVPARHVTVGAPRTVMFSLAVYVDALGRS